MGPFLPGENTMGFDTNKVLTHNRLLELIEYNPDTGIFTNKIRRSSGSPAGKVLGTKNAHGHLIIQIDNKQYMAHRLAWFYCFQEWPENILDHIDNNPSNNALDNLREADKSTNGFNSGKRSNNTSGYKGAFFDSRRNKYYSQIFIKGKKKWLGYFNTVEEASNAYINAAKELHGEFFNEDTC